MRNQIFGLVPILWKSDVLEDVLINQVEYRTHGMHSTNTEITDRSARGTMKGRGSATSFSSILLDKSVILLNPEDASALCP